MKRLQVWLAIIIGLFICMTVGLTYAARVKIGVIDSQRVLKESMAAKQARDVLLEDLKEKRELFNRKQAEVRTLEEEILREKESQSSNVLKAKQEELAWKVKNLRRLKTDLEEELNKKNNELTQTIAKEILKIVRDFSKKKQYTIIIEKNTVVAFDETNDITDTIIELYDKKQ